jgi:hypothetical protein
MQTNISESLIRAKLLINYNTSKTLGENYSIVKEGFPENPSLPDSTGDTIKNDSLWQSLEKQSDELVKKQISSDKDKKYPNYCIAKQYAVTPPKNKLGAEGAESLPEAHCYYMTPMGGVFLHQPGLEIEVLEFDEIESLVDIFMKYRYNDEKIKSKKITTIGGFPASIDKIREKIKEKLEESLLEYSQQIDGFKVVDKNGTIQTYTLKWGATFLTGMRADAQYVYAYPKYFSSYSCPDGNCGQIPEDSIWKNPVEVDIRSGFDKWMDDYGLWVELGTNALLILAQFIPGVGQVVGLSRLLLYTEVAVDVGFGVANTIREINREDEFSAGMSALFALLPLAFLRKGGKTLIGKIFSRGIDLSSYDSIAKKLISAKLGKTPTTAELYKFYKSLTPDERIVWKQFMSHDEATKLQFVKDIAKLLDEPATADELLKGLDEFWTEMTGVWAKYGKKNLESIDYMKRLWARQMSMVGIGMALDALGQFVGVTLNTEVKKELEWIGSTIPMSEQEMLFVNLALNPESINSTIGQLEQTPGYQDFRSTIDTIATGDSNNQLNKNFATFLNTEVDTLVNQTPPPTEVDIKEESLSEEKIKEIEKDGWAWQGDNRIIDWVKNSLPEFNKENYRLINKKWFVKVPLNLIKSEETPKEKEKKPQELPSTID